MQSISQCQLIIQFGDPHQHPPWMISNIYNLTYNTEDITATSPGGAPPRPAVFSVSYTRDGHSEGGTRLVSTVEGIVACITACYTFTTTTPDVHTNSCRAPVDSPLSCRPCTCQGVWLSQHRPAR
jgi:hypothetical protein